MPESETAHVRPARASTRTVALAPESLPRSIETLENRVLMAGTPFNGSPLAIPGTIEVEQFDAGPAGVAYQDTTPEDFGNNAYRVGEVDIQVNAGGGHSVGWITAEEWLDYTVNVATTGYYDLKFRVAAEGDHGGTFHVEFGGVDKTGPLLVPETGSWQTFDTLVKNNVFLEAGQQVMRLSFDQPGSKFYIGNFDRIEITPTPAPGLPAVSVATTIGSASEGSSSAGTFTVTRNGDLSAPLDVFYTLGGTASLDDYAPLAGVVTIPAGQAAATVRITAVDDVLAEGNETVVITLAAAAGTYVIDVPTAALTIADNDGSVGVVPGIIQMEDFDAGNAGVAYQDTTPENLGGVYRSTQVDLQTTSDTGGGYSLGWATPDEWLQYTINVAEPGQYDILVRVASEGTGGTFHLEFNGIDKTGTITVPNTGGWQTWQTLSVNNVFLDGGLQTMRVVFDTPSSHFHIGNFNWIQFVPRSTPLPTVAVDATDPDASESGPDKGVFTISRTGSDLTQPLTVNYTLGGSASSADHNTLSGTVTIPANFSSVTIDVTPVDDVLVEGNEMLVLTLAAGAAYTAGPTGGATITIADNDATVGQTPFNGSPLALPGRIEAENFDNGGAGVAYQDTTPEDFGNTGYRPAGEIDIQPTADIDGGYNLAWVTVDEWMEYTVNVPAAGLYDLLVRVAAQGVGGTFHIEVDGVDSTGAMQIPDTGGWQTWQTLTTANISLTAGEHVVRLAIDAGGSQFYAGNVNWLQFNAVAPTPNARPTAPTITEPHVDGYVVSPADVHMETAPFSDPDGDGHSATDWEIWTTGATPERVWSALGVTSAFDKVHIHLGDGAFEGSLAGQNELLPETDYVLRVRQADNSGDAATMWSEYAQRRFRTSPVTQPLPDAPDWTVDQAGYKVEVVATGFQLPVNIAFVPNPGNHPSDPLFYVTELYGNIKVVTNDLTVHDYATNLLNYDPLGGFPGAGEQGLSGIVVDPATGDVYASLLYSQVPFDDSSPHYPKIVKFTSTDGGLTAATQTVIKDFPGESQGQSHFISNLTIGPDGKLYVHMGDGFNSSTALNLESYRGKILRMNLDGSAPSDNPFYNAANGISARDFVYAYGFRNPFGGAWRASDGMHYSVENGPSANDRFARITRGGNYGWNGTNTSMTVNALYNWNPTVAPVNIAFIEGQTFGGSGFPQGEWGHAYVSESGPTYATGPQARGKRISEFTFDANGNVVGGPISLVHYTGDGKGTVSALAAGPDGLYFSDLYADDPIDGQFNPIAAGSSILRVRYVGTT